MILKLQLCAPKHWEVKYVSFSAETFFFHGIFDKILTHYVILLTYDTEKLILEENGINSTPTLWHVASFYKWTKWR